MTNCYCHFSKQVACIQALAVLTLLATGCMLTEQQAGMQYAMQYAAWYRQHIAGG